MNSPNTKDHRANPKTVYINWKGKSADPEGPGMYILTEISSAILAEMIAYTSREEMSELKKSRPDPKRFEELDALFREVHLINREPANFREPARMQEIIDKYAPRVREIYSKA